MFKYIKTILKKENYFDRMPNYNNNNNNNNGDINNIIIIIIVIVFINVKY